MAEFIPFLALRLLPGKNPDVDLWRFEGSVIDTLEGECVPKRVEGGWELGDCTLRAELPEGSRTSVFVPAMGDSGLEVMLQLGFFNVSISLSRVPQRDEPQSSDNVSLTWHQPGEAIHADIWAEDGLVFAPRFDGLIEILDAGSGEILGIADIAGAAGGEPYIVLDVKAHGGLLYAATISNGLVVFDVSRPSTPELIGQFYVFVQEGSPENFFNIHNIFLSPRGDRVYAINQSFPRERPVVPGFAPDLWIIDVADPTSPREAGRFSNGERGALVHDVNVIERDGRLIAFLNYWHSGLWILDVTESASIVALGSIQWDGITSHSGWPFALGDKLYYAHAEEGYDRHLTVLDVTDLGDPRVVSRFSTRPGISIHNVEVIEGIAYISYYLDGLRVVDLRNPEIPREIGHYDTVLAEDERDLFQGAFGVRARGGSVYVSDIEGGTYAFQVALD